MKVDEIKNISVLGAGIMGHGIAQSFIMGGYNVRLYDVKDSILDTAINHIKKGLDLFCREGLLSDKEVVAAFARLKIFTDLKDVVADASFIVEAAPEDLALKQKLLSDVEERCPTEAIIASNTSSLTLKDMGVNVKNKKRLIITHWFNPPAIIPVVELVKGAETSDETLQTAYALHEKIKKVPVKINMEMPGHLVNRIQAAMAREVFDLYEKGVASGEDIDKAVKGSIGFRLASIGPLLTADLGGLDLWLKGTKLLSQLQNSTEPSPVLQKLVAAGHLGIKTGKGFYEYEADFYQKEIDEVIQRRDHELICRLKSLYWKKANSKPC
jgi:3-hydroxybutyryl-CoA dehydrogenase